MKTRSEDEIRIHETFTIAGLLALVGGFLDAYTYMLRGHVFANAQTGNIVLVAVALAEGRFRETLIPLVPILAFILGVLVTEVIRKRCDNKEDAMWEHLVLLLEIIALIIVGFIPDSMPDAFANVLVSFTCAMQVCSFRKVRGMGYASTMCTGNLRAGTENLFRVWLGHEDGELAKARRYFGIILLFVVGAFCGGICSDIFGIRSVWICSVLLTVVFIVITYNNRKEGKDS